MTSGPVVSINLNTTRLDQLIAGLPALAHAVLDKAALDIESLARPMTGYDTGALRASIYSAGLSGGASSYAAGVSEASARRPGVAFTEQETPASPYERIVGASVEYAYFQEFIKPYLIPAVEGYRPTLESAWEKLLA